jgi:transcriptional regulator with XRE-family HTH domain
MVPAVKPLWRAQFGQRVRTSRLALEWTQERLADECGMHPTYIGDAERGERNVSLDNILKLAKALRMRPGELLDGLEKGIKLPR